MPCAKRIFGVQNGVDEDYSFALASSRAALSASSLALISLQFLREASIKPKLPK
jgi:hypothetical protein